MNWGQLVRGLMEEFDCNCRSFEVWRGGERKLRIMSSKNVGDATRMNQSTCYEIRQCQPATEGRRVRASVDGPRLTPPTPSGIWLQSSILSCTFSRPYSTSVATCVERDECNGQSREGRARRTKRARNSSKPPLPESSKKSLVLVPPWPRMNLQGGMQAMSARVR